MPDYVTFQQDNARPHVARVVRDYLTQQNVDLLPWPSISPDLSPIEHVWDVLSNNAFFTKTLDQ
jgi:transposase